MLSLQIRGHCVADLDPLGITQARHAETEEEARSKFLTTYRYHTIYNIGKVLPWPVEAACTTYCHMWYDAYIACMSSKISCLVVFCVSASGETWSDTCRIRLIVELYYVSSFFCFITHTGWIIKNVQIFCFWKDTRSKPRQNCFGNWIEHCLHYSSLSCQWHHSRRHWEILDEEGILLKSIYQKVTFHHSGCTIQDLIVGILLFSSTASLQYV